ncbi:MAG: DUF4352 domain-containing protein [Candidatus Nanopelagicales bacterium]
MADDPNLHWDGRQWLRWDGAQWIPADQQVASQDQPPAQLLSTTSKRGIKGWGWRKTLFAVWLGLFILFWVIYFIPTPGAPHGGLPTVAPTTAAPTTAAPTTFPEPTVTAPVGQPIRSGNFEFTVTNPTVLNSTLGASEETPYLGEWFVVNVTIKNIGKQSQTLRSYEQVAFDTNNQNFTGDFLVAGGVAGGSVDTSKPMTPGDSVSMQIAWDVPSGTEVSYLVLHGSDSSNGARVNIN